MKTIIRKALATLGVAALVTLGAWTTCSEFRETTPDARHSPPDARVPDRWKDRAGPPLPDGFDDGDGRVRVKFATKEAEERARREGGDAYVDALLKSDKGDPEDEK